MINSIVSVNWLHENLDKPDLIILDASFKKKRPNLTTELTEDTIKNARYFDIKKDFSDVSNCFPSAFPSAEQFEKSSQRLGINSSSIIVVFDIDGIYSSPRVWWLFKCMGHKNVAVLDGGYPEWLLHKFPTEKRVVKKVGKGNFKANLSTEFVRRFKDVEANVISKKELLVDVRSEKRFKSLVPEPKEGLRCGTIPNSINLPYTEVLKDGKYKSTEELKELFSECIQEDRPVIFSCGSGITACVVFLASEQLIENSIAVYDGSWTEWGTLVQ
ncbi:sulfurtransferase [Flavicella sediminum]|uniref:sulfurtransferase n=1 Tax=Flavicella sediminum TaxID=2585141 RepID=UPI00111F09E7|nr:sulfurtransferase [Flavicella sediminum]